MATSKKAPAKKSSASSGKSAAASSSKTASNANGNSRNAGTKSSTSGSKAASSKKGTGASAADHSEHLSKIFSDGLKDLYYAEKHLAKALPRLAKASAHQELANAFLTHTEQTLNQIQKLDQVFALMGMKPQAKKCPAMDGLIEEGKECLEEYSKGSGRDAAMIMAAQKAEHYEISAYGSLRSFAEVLGMSEVAAILDEILTEESDTDTLLSDISVKVNTAAMGNGTEADDATDSDDTES